MSAHQQIHANPSSALSCPQYVKSRLMTSWSKIAIGSAEKWAHLQSRPPPRAAVIAAAPVVQKIHVNVRLPEGSGTHWICVPKLGTHYARWTATLVKIPPVDKRLNKSTRTEEPVTVHMEVNRRKRVLSLTAPNTWLWCLSNIETSHADIASYTKPSVRVPVVQERVHCPCLDYAEEDEKAKGN